ncbi:MAG: glycosyltransferase family 4 protein [Chitinophagales bacterium]|nr:glycosyltransferase family 4 protein [Chitinophagales bacterium]
MTKQSGPRVVLTVTNDLNYDQRMQRIATSLTQAGYRVTLVGRVLPRSKPLNKHIYKQKRLSCFFQKGMFFYAEYNVRLFFLLLFYRFDAVGAVDYDTLPANTIASIIRRKKRVFDAHEYFTEVPELYGRNAIRAAWKLIGRMTLPFYKHAYTVGPALAAIFTKQHKIPFRVVRNVPRLETATLSTGLHQHPRILMYQGALNAGRGIEFMLEAMCDLPEFRLILAGEGDLSDQLRQQAQALNLGDRVHFEGFIRPEGLKQLTARAWMGINLLENQGESYYYSLANKFFDYVAAGVPVLTMDFPEYRALHEEFPVAHLLQKLDKTSIVAALRHYQQNPEAHRKMHEQCMLAREKWNWAADEAVLLEVWQQATS